MKNLTIQMLLCITLFPAILFSQQSSMLYYRSAVMDGNNVKTVFGNWGVIAQPIDTKPRGAWRYPANGYFGDESIMIGVEFPIKDYNNDGILDTLRSVITCPVARPAKNPDSSPQGDHWTFLPLNTTVNENSTSVPISNDPSSWPLSWNGQWKGMNAEGKIDADLESYFEMNDQNDLRYNFSANNEFGYAVHPDSTNSNRNGAGLRVAVRYLQFNDPLFKDLLFRVYDITNEGTTNYSKLFFGYLVGTYIGVTGATDFREYDDDYSIFYKKENLILAGDYPQDNSRNPFWRGSVGKVGFTFIDAPNRNEIGSYNYFAPAGNIDLRNDKTLWKMFSEGTNSTPASIVNDTTVLHGEDGDFTFGSHYFPLNGGETKRIASVIVFDSLKDNLVIKTKFAQVLYRNNFDRSKIGASLSLKNLNSFKKISETFTVQWNAAASTDDSVEIYFSPNAGETWSCIAEKVPNTGSYV